MTSYTLYIIKQANWSGKPQKKKPRVTNKNTGNSPIGDGTCNSNHRYHFLFNKIGK